MIANESKVERPLRCYLSAFFFVVFCGASPRSLRLQSVSKMWLDVLLTAFCRSSVNTRVGFNDSNFELFTSADVIKACRNKMMLA